MSELEKHMKPITFEQALSVFDDKPTEIKPDDVKPLTIEDAKKLISRD